MFDWEHVGARPDTRTLKLELLTSFFASLQFTGKRSYLMCMWNRWVAEKGPLLIHTGRQYICDWVERYRPLFLKYDLAAELRDHLMVSSVCSGPCWFDSNGLVDCRSS